MTNIETIKNIIHTKGFYGKTGRVRFSNYTYVRIAKLLNLDWYNMSDIDNND